MEREHATPVWPVAMIGGIAGFMALAMSGAFG